MDKLTYSLKLDLADIPGGSRDAAKREVADYLREAILQDVSRGISSVDGRAWKGLSKAYAEKKKKEVGNTKPNLELDGDMLDALDGVTNRSGVEVGIFDSEQAEKADGHCNHSGNSNLPLRRFIPDDDEKFRAGIMQEVESILDGYREERGRITWKGVELPFEIDFEDIFIVIE